MVIAFVHNRTSFLPEIGAYVDYFSSRGITCHEVQAGELKLLKPDVAWYFMGTNFKKLPGAVTIHEYTSASVEPYASLKNRIKKWANAKPDFRLFLNKYIKKTIGFDDEVPFGFRDMGIAKDWLQPVSNTNRKGFIYTGEWKNRDITKLLYWFAHGEMRGYPLLIISKDYASLKEKYSNFPNIRFEGPVDNKTVREELLKASFGINFIPDKEPFNQQTSTKLLEYIACGNHIITTDYPWVRDFQQQYGGNFLFLKDDLSNFNPQFVHAFEYRLPELREWTWEKQIESSGVVKFFASKFPELSW